MGLDAVVYCDCFEKGTIRRPPPQPDLVYVDGNGQVCLRWDAPGADQNAFFDWLHSACDHGPQCELVSHRLGNASRIGRLRSLLLHSPIEFPVLLTKVIYDGTHAGDRLNMGDVDRLSYEIGHLRTVHSQEESEERPAMTVYGIMPSRIIS